MLFRSSVDCDQGKESHGRHDYQGAGGYHHSGSQLLDCAARQPCADDHAEGGWGQCEAGDKSASILNDLEERGVEIEKFGPSTRPAANGIAYDHWARVIHWDGTGNDLAALVLDVAGSVDEYSITFDDVIERTISSLTALYFSRAVLYTKSSKSSLAIGLLVGIVTTSNS